MNQEDPRVFLLKNVSGHRKRNGGTELAIPNVSTGVDHFLMGFDSPTFRRERLAKPERYGLHHDLIRSIPA